MADPTPTEIPGVEDYLTLLDKASQDTGPLWRHEDLFKEPEVNEDEHGSGDRNSTGLF